MIILLTIIHVIVCLFLIIVVLLQSGKAADLAGAFGGMGSQTAFGPRGTASTVLETAPPPVTKQAPKQPGPIKMSVENEKGENVQEVEIPVPPPTGDQKQAPAKK